jgi:dienelactone hydrolase
MNKKAATMLAISLLSVTNLFAAIKTAPVEYQAGDVTMEGYVAYDDAAKSPQPGIMIVPDWMGLRQFAKDKAEQLAKEGYVAFAVDVYGKGVRPKDVKEAGQFATKYKDDRNLLRSHMKAAYDQFVQMKEVDPKKVVVMGYCFGGTAALELARSGAPLVGTATFHGGLSTPTPQDAKNIKGPVLVMHGGDDPFVNAQEVAAFKQEMKNANVNLTFVVYPGAVHAFTNPEAGNDNSKGAAYNKDADKKSWAEFEKFLKKVF